MGSWINLLAAAAPPVISVMMFLVSDGIEHTRMKHCLDIYKKAEDARTRCYLAEAVRAEAWKADQPLIWRHPTMNGCAYMCFAIFYWYVAIFMLWPFDGRGRGPWPFDYRGSDPYLFGTFLAFGFGSAAMSLLSFHKSRKVLPHSGKGDFSYTDVLPLDDIHAHSDKELRRLRERALRQIRDEIAVKEEIERRLSLLDPGNKDWQDQPIDSLEDRISAVAAKRHADHRQDEPPAVATAD